MLIYSKKNLYGQTHVQTKTIVRNLTINKKKEAKNKAELLPARS